MNRSARTATALAVYASSIVAANVLTTEHGMWPVGFGLTATAGTYSAGVALFARDIVQDLGGKRVVLLAIAIGGALSLAMAAPTIAVASVAAFGVGELLDMAVYTPLRHRGWTRAVIASNTVGGLIDTVVFLGIAGFGLAATTIAGQMVGKVLWATIVPLAIVGGARRAVSRHTVLTGRA